MTEEEFRNGGLPERDPYIAACDKVCSPGFNSEMVGASDLLTLLDNVAMLGYAVNLRKKVLFRGKRPEEIGLTYPTPGDELSLRVNPNEADLVHGVVGSITEVGELAEMLAARIRGIPADKINAVEETGDVTWYLSRVLKWAGVTFAQCFKINIDKLHGRHGETFNMHRDHNRDLAAERAGLEAGVAELPFEPRSGEIADMRDNIERNK